jgi:bloom syndrome protein
MPDSDGHEAIKAHSTVRLQQACETAVKKRKYNSLDTCTRLESVFSERSGFKPYGWQLDVAEAILLGLDCVVIAGGLIVTMQV